MASTKARLLKHDFPVDGWKGKSIPPDFLRTVFAFVMNMLGMHMHRLQQQATQNVKSQRLSFALKRETPKYRFLFFFSSARIWKISSSNLFEDLIF